MRVSRHWLLWIAIAMGTPAHDPLRGQPTTAAPCVRLGLPESIDPDERWFAPPPPDRARPCAAGVVTRPLGAEVRLSHRSGVPDTRGQGAGYAWNGMNGHLRIAVDVEWRFLNLRLAPEVAVSDNADFFAFRSFDGMWIYGPPIPSDRSSYASPWYYGPVSADLPSRHGVAPLARVHPGASGLWLDWNGIRIGATARQPRWGPGPGEGLILGTSAAGLPRLEAEWTSDHRFGSSALRWFSGAALESRFFDRDSANDRRAVAGLRVEHGNDRWRFGLSRTLMDGRANRQGLEAADLVFGRPSSDSLIDFLAVDLRWREPASRGLTWVEVIRQQPLRSGGDLMRYPTEAISFRLGFDHRVHQSPAAEWRASAEAIRLDQPLQRAGITPPDLYTSATVVQGWTHLGQPLGSGLGPGGQRQLISMERQGRVWSVRGSFERARWNDDALYRQFLPNWWRHDVSYQVGLRLSRDIADRPAAAQVIVGRRTSHLFQNDTHSPGYRDSDVPYLQVTTSIGLPRAGRSVRSGDRPGTAP
jgi:hypothetical protein